MLEKSSPLFHILQVSRTKPGILFQWSSPVHQYLITGVLLVSPFQKFIIFMLTNAEKQNEKQKWRHKVSYNKRLEDLTSLVMKGSISWDIMLYLPKVNQHSGGTSPPSSGSKKKPNKKREWSEHQLLCHRWHNSWSFTQIYKRVQQLWEQAQTALYHQLTFHYRPKTVSEILNHSCK
jgi:hypothetical protein